MKLLIVGHSSLGTHRVSIGFLTRFHIGTNRFVIYVVSPCSRLFCTKLSTSLMVVTPGRALPMARRLIASFQQSGWGCSHAPLPGIRRNTSTNASSSPELLVERTTRTNCNRSAFFLHPIHVRTVWLASAVSNSSATAFFANCAVPSSVFGHQGIFRPGSSYSTAPFGRRPKQPWRRRRCRCASR